jgi:hypothetical protein
MKRISLYVFLVMITGVSCSREKKGDEFTIQGIFSNSHGEKVIFGEMDVREFIPLDSTEIDADGTVSFSCRTDQPGFYFLQFAKKDRMILLMEKKEHLTIRGNLADKPENFILTGSKGSELLHDFFRISARNKSRVDSVKGMLQRQEGSEDFLRFSLIADSLFARISEDQKKAETDFIDRNPQSLASLLVLNFSFGLKPVLTPESDFSYYQKLTNLSRQYPANKHVIFHLKRMDLYRAERTAREN